MSLRKRHCWPVVCAFATLLSPVAVGLARGATEGTAVPPSGDAAAAFLREAVPYWTAAEARMGQMSGTYVEELTFPSTAKAPRKPPGTTIRRVRYAFDAQDRSAMDSITGLFPKDDGTSVFATNQEYKFNVHARAGPAKKFSIDRFDVPRDIHGDFFDQISSKEFLYRVLSAESFENCRLTELPFDNYGSRILDVRYVQRPEGLRAEMRWDYPPRPDEERPHVTAILNPANHWAIESWRRVYARGVITCESRLQTVADGMPFIKTLTWTSFGHHEDQVSQSVCRFEMPTFEPWTPKSAEKFTLSTYGLPVPGRISAGSKLVVVNAVVLLVVGIVLAALSRRKAKRQAQL